MENKNNKALIITAHSDDETIWMGGTILMHKDWHWRIVSLSQFRGEVNRFLDLEKAVRKYRESGVLNIKAETSGLLDTMDENEIKRLGQYSQFREYLENFKESLKDYSVLFTHNQNGEYWPPHPQHQLVNKVVLEMFKEREVYQFWCPIHGENLDDFEVEEVKLDEGISKIKKEIFEGCYLGESGLWDVDNIPREMDFEFNKRSEMFIRKLIF